MGQQVVEDVVDGWGHQIGETTGGRVETEGVGRLPGVLRLDPAALRRSFCVSYSTLPSSS